MKWMLIKTGYTGFYHSFLLWKHLVFTKDESLFIPTELFFDLL